MIEPHWFSLSSTQQSVWLDQLLSPETPSYNIGVTIEVHGTVDLAVFDRAVRAVIAQHDALRLVFREHDGQARQRVLTSLEPPLRYHDLRAEPDAHAQALAAIGELNRTPFALYEPPLWDMQWFQLSDSHALWNSRYHHLICDGTSVSLVGNAVTNAYDQLMRGEQPEWDEQLAQGYQHFAAQDQQYLVSERYAKARAYWLEQFPALPDPLFQPLDTPAQLQVASTAHRPSAQATWTLGRRRLEALTHLARTQGAGLSHCLSALLANYFSRMTDQRPQVVIGLPVHNRANALQKRTAGMFSSVLPLAIQVDPQAGFAHSVQQIANQVPRSYRHQRYPLQALHRELRTQAGHAGQLFEVMLSVEQFAGDLQFGATRTVLRTWHNGYERYPLAIYLRDYEALTEPFLEFNYDPQRFSAEQIAAHLRRLERLTELVLAEPNRPLHDWPLLDADEQHQVLQLFNATAREYPAEQPLPALFAEWVRHRPDALALVEGERTLNYRQLAQRVEHLARHLEACGVGPGDRVALRIPRGASLVVSILAIVQRGAAYVPVDMDAPPAHLARVLSDCGSAWLLVANTRPAVPDSVRFIDVEALPEQQDGPPTPAQSMNAGDIAYVMYTSGSTGTPKGVQVPHRAIVRLVINNGFADFNAQDRIALAANPAFDASTLEIWGALLNGG
ncbi:MULTISPECIES: condensation domain-containing protein, partial [unclassified Pseudomonas]|uniref:condensation domain-containing protein n=1 Tax=unclassified Pseudomonas TaxID=196821 RepID=UPI0035BEC441